MRTFNAIVRCLIYFNQISMFSDLKKFMKKFTAVTIALGTFLTATLPAQAFTLVETVIPPQVKITEHSIGKTTFDPTEGETASINYCLYGNAKVKVGIYAPEGQSDSNKVAILVNNETKNSGCYSVDFNGRYGSQNEAGEHGEYLEEGRYFYMISAVGIDGSAGEDDAYKWFTVGASGSSDGKFQIIDFEAENPAFDPQDDQEAELSFTLSADAYVTLEVLDEDDEEIATLIDNDFYESGEHSYDWDGRNREGDFVQYGEYTIKLKIKDGSRKDSETITMKVKKDFEDHKDTKEPRLKNVFVSKDNFDPGQNESVKIVFTMLMEGDVTVAIYKGDKKIETLVDDENVAPGTYSAEWDGDEAINAPGDYSYRVYTQNDKGEDIETGTIEVEEDFKQGKKPNIYRDEVEELTYSPKSNNLTLNFKLEREADMTLEIRENDKVVAVVTDTEYFAEGSQTIYWDGQDDDGDYVLDGIYEYKLIAANEKGKDVEKGFFLVEDTGVARHGELCSNFIDIEQNYKYCEAIEWAIGRGIFQGYNDGTFKPEAPLKRSEALKVILEALDLGMTSKSDDTFGFYDVYQSDWYLPYLQTALELGIVKGYADGSFQPNRTVNRVEALTMLLNTAKIKDGLIIPTNVYGQAYFDTPVTPESNWYQSYVWFAKTYGLNNNENYFYPANNMTRGEMAEMLYKYEQANF